MTLAIDKPCFTAPSYRTFRLLVAGWIHCPGRRMVTAVAVASGGVEQQHISVFHRFFSRATWSLDALGQVVFRLALRWIPADQPLIILVDDTLVRKTGKGVSLAVLSAAEGCTTTRCCRWPASRSTASGTSGSCWPSDPVADGGEPWVRAAAAVSPVCLRQVWGDQGCARSAASWHPAAGRGAGPCGTPPPDQAGGGP
jgi:hypothetical protein